MMTTRVIERCFKSSILSGAAIFSLLICSACFADEFSSRVKGSSESVEVVQRQVVSVARNAIAVDIVVTGYINPPITNISQLTSGDVLALTLKDCRHQLSAECVVSYTLDLVPIMWFE